MFCDKVSIYIKAGNGGDGVVSFLHEKYREFGGPAGGDGGKGGSVIFQADENVNTLYYFKTHHKLTSENGERGGKRRKHGKNGQDLIIKVPIGTILIDETSGETIGDLSEAQELVVAKGGDGGFGNAHFTSSTRQAPRVAELGEPGEEKNIILELKLVADVGFVGLPNVGKSTLLSVVSAAKPKIADYEFTTIVPNLGVIEEGTFGVERGFVAADIPGLIEGASQGKGLGDDFLRHIERTKVLVHILDAMHKDLRDDYQVIRKELKSYVVDLSDKPEIVVINKIDAITPDELSKKLEKVQAVVKSKILLISAVAHKNLPDVLHEIEKKLLKEQKKKVPQKPEEYKVFTMEDVVSKDSFEVKKEDGKYIVTGPKIERFAIRTDFSNPYAVQRFKDIMKRTSVEKELKRFGAEQGDKIVVSGKEFIL
jgi:GTP-binding protein